jgi:hypothetical protein
MFLRYRYDVHKNEIGTVKSKCVAISGTTCLFEQCMNVYLCTEQNSDPFT